MKCKVCGKEKDSNDFYANDSTCKEDRKKAARENRAKNKDYYKEYDKNRFKNDPRVKARHEKYAKSEAGKVARKKSKKKWIDNNLIKRGAHKIVNNAIRDGKLFKEPCVICGSNENTHAHHDDYAQPLNVRWLCPIHHKEWHDMNGEGLNG